MDLQPFRNYLNLKRPTNVLWANSVEKMKLTHMLGHFPSSVNLKTRTVSESGLLRSSGEAIQPNQLGGFIVNSLS
jgi:hypothetical protein